MSTGFADRTVLVAGGTGGLGRAVQSRVPRRRRDRGRHVSQAGRVRRSTRRRRRERDAAFGSRRRRHGRGGGARARRRRRRAARPARRAGERGGRVRGRREALGGGGKGLRPDAHAEPALGLRARARRGAGDAEAGPRRDRERRREGGLGSPRRRGRLCRVEGGGRGDAGLAGGGSKRHGAADQLDPAKHHRHRAEPESDAEGRLLEMAESPRRSRE